MRADRLLGILFTLRADRRTNARQLAEMFEVSERTILRDMDALLSIGVPVQSERGPNGGWYLSQSLRADVSRLSRDELVALFVGLSDVQSGELGFRKASRAAIAKLKAALPGPDSQSVEKVATKIHIDPLDWPTTYEKPDALPILLEALIDERKVVIGYEKDYTVVDELAVGPLGLVKKSNSWYFIGLLGGEPKVYKVVKIAHARVLSIPAQKVAGFNLESYWTAAYNRCLSNFQRYQVLLLTDARTARRLQQGGHFSKFERISAVTPAGSLVEISYECETDAVEHLMSFGPALEVLEPTGLRNRITTTLAQTFSRYAATEAKKQA